MRLIRLAGLIVVALLASLGLAILLMSYAAPHWIDGNEADAAVLAVAAGALRASSREVTYLSLGGRDPQPEQMAELQRQTKSRLLPYSARPKDTCVNQVVPPFCENDDFLMVSVSSMPLWRTALVHASTLACGTEHVMFKGPTGWVSIRSLGFCA